ncbi:hypothetical protein HZS_8177 [Henneguya salminicola]|nr:hypothetical protein HZS_8177 [Henneguya salminicola]
MSNTQAEEFKSLGNDCVKNQNYSQAIEHYTKAIEICPTNYTYYSNRAAAYASIGKHEESLSDAKKTIELSPTWAKGYSRLGTALEYLGKQTDAIEAYKKGLEYDPNNAQLSNALNNLETNMTQDDDSKNFLNNANFAELLKDPEFLRKMSTFKDNPMAFMNDPMMKDIFSKCSQPPQNQNGHCKQSECEDKNEAPKKSMEMTTKEKALQEKTKGNDFYKKRQFEDAIAHYAAAKELDPDTILYDLNISAVLFEQKKYDECIKICEEAAERGRSIGESYKIIAKVLSRIGNAYYKQEKLEEAIKYYKKSIIENRDSEILGKIREVEKKIQEMEKLKYINPEISEQEREAGNKCFSTGDFPQSILHYTESIKRNPSDPKSYSNRAAAYTKLMEYHLCITDCDKSISLDPLFIKSYLRKANALIMLKDPQQAKTVYDKVLEMEPKNHEALMGVSKCYELINSMNPEQAAEQALRDPEVQAILNDPSMRVVLDTMKGDPQACSAYMGDPVIARKIEKLIDAGIIRVGSK